MVDPLEEALKYIRGSFVWQHRFTESYRPWVLLAELLDAYKSSPKQFKKRAQEITAQAEEALNLPKARRDQEFRILCYLVMATVEALTERNKRGG